MIYNFQLNHVELSPNYAGTLFGITNMVANLTGFITPWVTGLITNNNVSLVTTYVNNVTAVSLIDLHSKSIKRPN